MKKKIYNWSKTSSSTCSLVEPNNISELKIILKKNKKISIMGGGNSYNESCLVEDGGTIISLQKFNKILSFKKNILHVESGVTINEALFYLLPRKYILKSIPGSDDATIGGCISSNVHGKDSFKYGTFESNILELKVINKKGNVLIIKPKDKLFKYAVGTFGYNFIILEIKLKCRKIKGNFLFVIQKKFNSQSELINLFNKFKKSDYMGAWIDHFDKNGRGIFKSARWVNIKSNKVLYQKSNFIAFFKINFLYPVIKFFFINRLVIKYLNKFFYFFSNNSTFYQNFYKFYFPQQILLPKESLLFPKGKVNIQILIPKKKILFLLKKISKLCIEYKLESWWMGMKGHCNSNHPISFAKNGFDITLQWSKRYIENIKFRLFYKKLFSIIIKNECLVYLTQDILLSSTNFKMMYKNYKKVFLSPKNSIQFYNKFFKRIFKKI